MFKFFKRPKYRVVRDGWSGFEAQKRFLYFFYIQIRTNTHTTKEKAKEFARDSEAEYFD